MKIVLKKEFRDTSIYVPFENRTMIGKFINEGLYPYMYEKYPDLFELICEKCENTTCKCKKTKLNNDISINDTKYSGNSDIE